MKNRTFYPLYVLVFALYISIMAMAGCQHIGPGATVNHPGQISTFDGTAYDALIVAQASITQAKTLIPAHPEFKTELNQAIAAYNTAIAAYKLYHSQAAGAPSSSEIQGQVALLTSSVSQLLSKLGVGIQ